MDTRARRGGHGQADRLVLGGKTLGPDCNKMCLQINEKFNPKVVLVLYLNLSLYSSKELKTEKHKTFFLIKN